jgi:NAD(P)-dependent dehydrogenase (short-subunit alcohol dehydrogenase family)
MTAEQPLSGQTILVIGGSAGIGLETARRARSEGGEVIITARDPDRVHRAGRELGGSIAAFDATDPTRLAEFFDGLRGPVDHILVTGPRGYNIPLVELDDEDARRDVDAHLLLPLHVARHAAGRVRPGGTLVFIGCTDRRPGSTGLAFTGALGAALSALTEDLARELAPIRVNLIAAGSMTPPAAATPSEEAERREQLPTSVPTRRVVEPGDIAALAVHLMTNTAVTGVTIDIDGGQRLDEP